MNRLSGDVKILIGLLLFLIIMACLFSGRQPDDGTMDYVPIRSSYSVRRGGVKALYDTLKAIDYPVQRNTSELTAQIDDGVLFVISPITPISQQEWDALAQWVHRGNLLVYACDTAQVPEEFDKDLQISHSAPSAPSFLTPGVRKVDIFGRFRTDTEMQFSESSEAPPKIVTRKIGMGAKPRRVSNAPRLSIIPLFSDSAGTVVGYSRWGRGEVITLADGWLLSNRGINQGDNFRMVLNALQHQNPTRKLMVTFDEYHHGYGGQKGIMSLIDLPAKIGLGVIAVAFILLVFSASRRFGKPIPLLEEGRQRGEYLSSMSALLRRGRATELVRQELGQRFLSETAIAVGVAPESKVDTIILAAEKRYPDKVAVLRELCEAAVSNAPVNDETAILTMARRWHKMKEELTK